MSKTPKQKVPEAPMHLPIAPPVALTIAGFDPSSGAGITADLKTFAAHGVYGVSCATALTVQSTQGVRRVVPVEADLVSETLACLADDIELAGIKIGMLGTASVASAVAAFLETSLVPRGLIVLDPVLRSSSGASLLDEAGVAIMRERLLAEVGWITPNLDELAMLVQTGPLDRDTVPKAAERLRGIAQDMGNDELNVVVTGGHLDRPDDYYLHPASRDGVWLPGEHIETTSTHGTGCAFSSALLCALLSTKTEISAVGGAKQYVTEALHAACPVGRGRGPMHHLYRFGRPFPTSPR